MKKILTGLVVCMMVVFVATGCESKKGETGLQNNADIQTNTNEKVIGSQEVSGLKFDNVSLIYENGESTFSANVTNVTAETIEVDTIKVIFKNADGSVLDTLPADIGGSIVSGTTNTFTTRAAQDLTAVDSITYELVK